MIVAYSPAAQNDRLQIFIEGALRFDMSSARTYQMKFDEALRSTLGVFPNAGRIRPEFGVGIRSFPILPYVAFYRVQRRRIEIIRILHAHRDIHGDLLSLLIAG
ncbi:MAG TPA: type II toxin-antitoxin system RelE/ParE family toxin [Candidatus Aquilonibacter sp.]